MSLAMAGCCRFVHFEWWMPIAGAVMGSLILMFLRTAAVEVMLAASQCYPRQGGL
jgi:hypothetical protein